MTQYFNAEAAEDLEDEYDDFIRGIPDRFEEFVEEVRSCDRVPVEGKENGMVRNMVGGRTYGFLETREDSLPEVVLDFGRYDEDAGALVDTTYVEVEHVQDTVKVVRVGENDNPYPLVEFRGYMMEDDWDSKVIDMSEIDLEAYMPFH